MPNNKIRPFSYSQLNAYSGCSRKWFFRYKTAIKTDHTSGAFVLGTAMHYLVQSAVTFPHYNIDMLPSLWPSQFMAARQRYPEDTLDAQEIADNYQIGVRMLESSQMQAAVEQVQQAGIEITEEYINFELDGVSRPIIGYIDMIDGQGVPWDIKTTGRMWSQADFDNDRQSSLYLIGLMQLGRIKEVYPLKFRFLIITKAKKPRWVIKEIERTHDDITVAKNWIHDIASMIDAGTHRADPRPDWMCSYCDFYQKCKRGLIAPPKLQA